MLAALTVLIILRTVLSPRAQEREWLWLTMPVLGSVKHDWEKEQIAVLTSAEEFDLLEQYKQALAERDKRLDR